jgi:hypothetical protein
MDIGENFKKEHLKPEIIEELNLFLNAAKKKYPNIVALIGHDDSRIDIDEGDDPNWRLDVYVVSDDFLGGTNLQEHWAVLLKIAYEISRVDLDVPDICPMPITIENYFNGRASTEAYLRSFLFYGDEKYEPSKVYQAWKNKHKKIEQNGLR